MSSVFSYFTTISAKIITCPSSHPAGLRHPRCSPRDRIGSGKHAANRLGITQPAASANNQSLESSSGKALFDRVARGCVAHGRSR
ncbi:helix-turn-helix domain-containing protein [Agrobacterium sp. 22-226-1]